MLTVKVVPQHLRLGQHRFLASRPITPSRVRARGRQAGLSSRRPALQNPCHPPCPQGALSVPMCNVPPPAVAAVKMLLPRETILSPSRLFSFSFFFFRTLAHDISRLIRCAISLCWCSALKRRAGFVPAKDVSHRRPCWNSDRRPHIGCTRTQVRHTHFTPL
jgi:hypothetical protein